MAQATDRGNGAGRRLAGWFAVVATAAAIAACGGGGDLAGNRVTLPVGGAPTGGSGSGGSGTSADGTITLTVVDQASGLTQNAISFTALAVAKVVVKDAQGVPVANAVVSFESSDEDEIVFSPADTALTDSSGAASVTVKPATLTTAGAYTLTAVVEVAQKQLRSSFNVAVGAANVGLGTLSAGQSPLSAYGTTVLSVPVTGVPADTPVTVRFASSCAAQNPARATIGALVSSISGVARTTYVDRGCAGTDLITATVEGTSVTKTASLQVLAPALANVQFVSATPLVIALRGTGGVQGPGTGVAFPEISTVRFQVVDQAGNPVMVPTNVTLRLSNDTGACSSTRSPDLSSSRPTRTASSKSRCAPGRCPRRSGSSRRSLPPTRRSRPTRCNWPFQPASRSRTGSRSPRRTTTSRAGPTTANPRISGCARRTSSAIRCRTARRSASSPMRARSTQIARPESTPETRGRCRATAIPGSAVSNSSRWAYDRRTADRRSWPTRSARKPSSIPTATSATIVAKPSTTRATCSWTSRRTGPTTWARFSFRTWARNRAPAHPIRSPRACPRPATACAGLHMFAIRL
ncbi:MAG: Ig-like domain-containing protein [Burkholderiaceae bacterium]|nr:Ig-like domain-containing protein [Burkholderiaceae bacterium]